MDHKEITENEIIEKYLLGKLSSDEADAFEEHLFFCKKCMDELNQARIIIEAVQTKEEQEIINKIQTSAIKRKKSKKVYLYAGMAVAAILATLAIVFIPQYYQKQSESKTLKNLSKIERKKLKIQDRKLVKEIKEQKNFANNPKIIQQQQTSEEPSFANNPILDSSINEELAYAEIRGMHLPVLIDPLPANEAQIKHGEKISFSWSSNYDDVTYTLTIYNNKGDQIHRHENIKSVEMLVEYDLFHSNLPPGLYYWRVIPSEDIEYPHTGKFKIK